MTPPGSFRCSFSPQSHPLTRRSSPWECNYTNGCGEPVPPFCKTVSLHHVCPPLCFFLWKCEPYRNTTDITRLISVTFGLYKYLYSIEVLIQIQYLCKFSFPNVCVYIILALQGWGPLCVQTWYSGCNQWLVVFVSLLWSWTGVWTGVPNKVASQCPCCWYNFFLARLFIEAMESMSATWSSRTDMWWRHLIGWIQASNHASNYILFFWRATSASLLVRNVSVCHFRWFVSVHTQPDTKRLL